MQQIVFVLALLALFMTSGVTVISAQESLGEAARRLRSQKNNGVTAPATTDAPQPVSHPWPVTAAVPVAQPQPASADDINASMNLIAETDMEKYSHGVRMLLTQERFRALDDVAAAERQGKTRFAGGFWKLAIFYGAIEAPWITTIGVPAAWSAYLERMNRWTAASPNSITARVALASAELQYGWMARGTGYADSVTSEGSSLFDERVALAEAMLNKAYDLPEKDPAWYNTMMNVGRAKGWEMEDLNALFQRAIAFEPQYYYYYKTQAFTLMPKWYGADGEVEKFAEESANKAGGKPGDILYWLIAQSILCNCDLGKIPQRLDWARAVKGYQALVEQYGASIVRQNQYALMAAKIGDFVIAYDTLAQVGEQWDQEVWGTREYFDKVKTWAANGAVPYKRMIVAIEAINVNMATAEGKEYDSVIAKEFSAHYAVAVQQCTIGANMPGNEFLAMRVDKSGQIQQVVAIPDADVEPCLLAKLEKAKFPPPPKPEYWIKASLKSTPQAAKKH